VAEKTFAVWLTIPDNEAFTARETLRRMGIAVEEVRRADIWTFVVDDAHATGLHRTIATMETIFNPNKHHLQERAGAHPASGEVWIAPNEEPESNGIGGRAIQGVRAIRRRTAWRLLDGSGNDVAAPELERAIEMFLCNPAFQKAIR
jgi:phosphoribosylformylglycinamidine (FGAM) synthase PurS component